MKTLHTLIVAGFQGTANAWNTFWKTYWKFMVEWQAAVDQNGASPRWWR